MPQKFTVTNVNGGFYLQSSLKYCHVSFGDINGTLGVINVFNEAVKERNQHHIQSSIDNLCRSINQLAKCLEKPTTQYCGRKAADMVLRYIALGFSGSIRNHYKPKIGYLLLQLRNTIRANENNRPITTILSAAIVARIVSSG
ncbi:unnamed protein product [Enterobius vermicularis]|uniref:Transcription factor n=1 Tax=Enterobius vermicularis TaxID=51028 RepID=A0A0N4V706_ENTVE|nr:unnamed protein product [Enterobius vermicularis]